MTDHDQPTGSITWREVIAIVYRRRFRLLAPAVAGLVAAVVAVLMTASVFRSSATLLITSQQIPTTVVASPLTNYADERIAKIRQKIMSRSNLTGLIAAKGLYASERAQQPLDVVLATMRGAIGVDLVGTNTGPRLTAAGSTIAFKLSFDYRDPLIAQAVTERLTAMFLDEDKRLRTEQAMGTAAFLGRRVTELRDQLVAIAGRRRAIEARYAGALPEQVAVSAQAGAALRAEVSRTDAESQGSQEQNGLLAVHGQEIAAAPPPGADALHRAEEKLAQLSAVYADDYPDVVGARHAVERQRAGLRGGGAPRGSGMVATEIAAGRSRIGTLAARCGALIQSLSNLDRLTSLGPQAAYERNNLERDYESVRLQYQGIREKQMDAQVAANLQTEDKGERFSVVDTPSLSTEPLGAGPGRMLVMGMIAGLAIGLMSVLAWELLDGPIHGESGVTRHTGLPPLIMVPMLDHGVHATKRAWWWARQPRWLPFRAAEAVA